MIITLAKIPWEIVFYWFGWVILVSGALWYAKESVYKRIVFRYGIWIISILYMMYATLLSFIQYSVWLQNPIGKSLVTIPLDKSVPTLLWFCKLIPGGYFIHYSIGRFFLPVILTIGIALIWGLFLNILRARQDRFFNDGEVELGVICALVVGWPQVILFVPFALLITVCIALIKIIIAKEQYTTIGWPLIISAGAVLIIGELIVDIMRIGVLRI